MADDIKKLLEEEKLVDEELDKPIAPALTANQGEPATTQVERGEPGSDTTAEVKQEETSATSEETVSPVDAKPEEKLVEAASTDVGRAEPASTVKRGKGDEEQAEEGESEAAEGLEEPEVKTPAAVSEKGMGGKKLPGHIVLEKSDDPRAKWYVIHTYSGHEARVAENLKQRVQTLGISGQVLEMFIPTQDKIEIRGGKKHSVTEKIFPGYLLVKIILTDPTWLAVRTTPGVTGFVGTGSKPTPLSEQEVATIQRFAAMGAPKFKTKFSIGEAVRIIDGPFADYLGSIGAIDEEKGRLSVLVSIFGRETPVELDFLQVTKI